MGFVLGYSIIVGLVFLIWLLYVIKQYNKLDNS